MPGSPNPSPNATCSRVATVVRVLAAVLSAMGAHGRYGQHPTDGLSCFDGPTRA